MVENPGRLHEGGATDTKLGGLGRRRRVPQGEGQGRGREKGTHGVRCIS